MNVKSQLQEAWKRLESLSAALWNDNSPRAVEAQALLEEFRGEMARFDSITVLANENHALASREHELSLAGLRAHFEAELAVLKKRNELLGKSIHDKDVEIESLLTGMADHERKNADFHAMILKSATDSDEAVSLKMEKFYQDMRAKEAQLEGAWLKRGMALEAEGAHDRELLAAKQAELEAWERRRIDEESALKKRANDLEFKAQRLQEEYRLKQQEIEAIKAGIQRNVSELVKQYQSRLKADASAPVTPGR